MPYFPLRSVIEIEAPKGPFDKKDRPAMLIEPTLNNVRSRRPIPPELFHSRRVDGRRKCRACSASSPGRSDLSPGPAGFCTTEGLSFRTAHIVRIARPRRGAQSSMAAWVGLVLSRSLAVFSITVRCMQCVPFHDRLALRLLAFQGVRMTAFNVVRFKVESGKSDAFLAAHQNILTTWPGLLEANIVEASEGRYFLVAKWASNDALAAARPNMIETLNSFRHLLLDLGNGSVTDAISGKVVLSIS